MIEMAPEVRREYYSTSNEIVSNCVKILQLCLSYCVLLPQVLTTDDNIYQHLLTSIVLIIKETSIVSRLMCLLVIKGR